MDRSGLLPLWADMEKKPVGGPPRATGASPRFHYYKTNKESRAGVALRSLCSRTRQSSGPTPTLLSSENPRSQAPAREHN